MHVSDVPWPLTSPRILVVGMAEYEAVLARLQDDAVSSANVVGMLVDPSGACGGAEAVNVPGGVYGRVHLCV